jgi:putative hydrolase of the HAD superfamily
VERIAPRKTVVLFDWRGTLFHYDSYEDSVRKAAASIGRRLTDSEVIATNRAIDAAVADPVVVAALTRADASQEAYRAGVACLFEVAGLDAELANALYERDAALDANHPYPDTKPVLRELVARGRRLAVVSDIHFPLRPHFEQHGLADLVEAWVLSFEHDFQKPEPKGFLLALEMLGVGSAEALMVGDRAERDGGAAAVGITTLILPPVPNFTTRGLDTVLSLV